MLDCRNSTAADFHRLQHVKLSHLGILPKKNPILPSIRAVWTSRGQTGVSRLAKSRPPPTIDCRLSTIDDRGGARRAPIDDRNSSAECRRCNFDGRGSDFDGRRSKKFELRLSTIDYRLSIGAGALPYSLFTFTPRHTSLRRFCGPAALGHGRPLGKSSGVHGRPLGERPR